MKKNYILCSVFSFLFLLANVSSSSAQSSSCYAITGIPYAPDTLTAPVTASIGEDQYSGVINIGFPFCFFGNYYTQCIIGSNGTVSFNLANAYNYSTWPINQALPSPFPADMCNSIMGPWEDLYLPLGGTVKYQTLGVAPNRKFVVEFKNIAMYACNNLLFTGQISLNESTNDIETQLGNKPLCPTWNGGHSVLGLQNINGTVAVIVPGRNASAWTAANEGIRFSPICQCPNMLGLNVISGKVFRDDNSNCIQDIGEPGLANRFVRIGSWPFFLTTDAQGKFVMNVDTGTFAIGQSFIPPYNAQLCPANDYTALFSTSPLSFPNADFADTIKHCHDIGVGLVAGRQRPCRRNDLYVHCCNYGPLPAYNTVVTITLNDSSYLISPTNYIAHPSANVYEYSLDTVLPGQCIDLLIVDSLSCNAAIGSTLCYSASITADSVDCFIENNFDNECAVTRNSSDPNDKEVASGNFHDNGYVTQENITANDTLTYSIRFQNTGNDTAYTVVVMDTISPFLDAGTIRMIASSHSCNLVLNGNVAIFSFNYIMLPDSNSNEPASHGMVKFSIRQRQGNMQGTTILNNAGIYFDLNSAVITNQTVNIIPIPASVHELSSSSFIIYPNPASDYLTLHFAGNTAQSQIRIINLLGELKYSSSATGAETNLNISSLAGGIYFVEVAQGNKVSRERFVKQ
jgi:uncharacterized repeat protein (TIGR01451 family)